MKVIDGGFKYCFGEPYHPPQKTNTHTLQQQNNKILSHFCRELEVRNRAGRGLLVLDTFPARERQNLGQ